MEIAAIPETKPEEISKPVEPKKEEIYVRKFIYEQTPDIVINVLDATNLERNLFLTTQLIDMDLRIVVALSYNFV